MKHYEAKVNIEHEGRELTAFTTFDMVQGWVDDDGNAVEDGSGPKGERYISKGRFIDEIEVQDSATGEIVPATKEIREKVVVALVEQGQIDPDNSPVGDEPEDMEKHGGAIYYPDGKIRKID